jgi:hypothetical protein
MKRIAALFILSVMWGFRVASASAQAYVLYEPFDEKWQVGAAGSLVNPDYTDSWIGGVMVYGSYNVSRNLGIEARARYAAQSNQEHEFSFTSGYRFMAPIKRVEPFAGGLVGYGHFGDTNPLVKVTQPNSFVISFLAGMDLHATRHWNVRLFEVEAQVWTDFPPNGLNPVAYSAGLAYHR